MVGSKGALNDIFALKRPVLKMIVGEPIPACKVEMDDDIREVYAEYSEKVMDKVFAQLPASVLEELFDIEWETFSLSVEAVDAQGLIIEIPQSLEIKQQEALALLFHRPGILKIFRVNLHMPVESLEHLHLVPSSESMLTAITLMDAYLEDEKSGNPYLLTYRFDIDRGKAMLEGLKELKSLLKWAVEHQAGINLVPERRFFSRKVGKEVIQTQQGEFDHWR